ncbi:adenylate cyclase [Rhizobium sp. BK196]|uniref:adenylate/guanylate cyclase domain-containing protein n=1 Tax=Rhizobium sp. BK196 TaxID=2587073 RepID=UPI00160AE1CC|nr:adenylate/guanylate cyclase domain-containing protein [Rhizobium sp. BK196]MBB3309338.1 adenylate cyclase [Rhizobium sp. BK196]
MDHKTPFGEGDAAREIRSTSLRFVVLLILFANLVFGDSQSSFATHVSVALVYLGISVASIVTATRFPARENLKAGFVALDAVLVVVVLYEHILASPITDNHTLTTSSLVVAFILLNHIALKLDHRLIVLFSSIVVACWLTMLAIMAYRHHANAAGSLLGNFFSQDLVLTSSFGFTALAVYLVSLDHDRTRRHALKIEERRMNLSRFFSPTVVSDLQDASAVLDLERRDAAIMFVDIRDFTSYSEIADPREFARVLAEYRRIVAGTVFAYRGTVDKFIGDGVMAVFGQPKPQPDDASRALACAVELTAALDGWRLSNSKRGSPALATGVGLHYGTVIGGVLESGFHDEFTVIGDAVNVAQRLEALAKFLAVPLVVSVDLLRGIPGELNARRWHRQQAVKLTGRREPIDIAYIRANSTSTAQTQDVYETGNIQSDFQVLLPTMPCLRPSEREPLPSTTPGRADT